jgi:pimeloyl-ACP methyl ester carboxylesterase
MRRRAFVMAIGAAAGLAVAERRRRSWTAWRTASDADPPDELRFPWTATHRVPTADGGQIHVAECGDGPTVLLLHGYGGNLSVFGLLARHLVAAGRHVVAVDQRGFGMSSPPPSTFGFDGLVEDVVAVLEGRQIREAVIAGHSMGGAVALGLAIARPDVVADRITGLVLVNSTARGPADGRVMRARVDLLDSRLVEWLGRDPRRGVRLARANFGDDARWSHVVATHAAGLDNPVARRRGLSRRLLGVDLTVGLADIDVPVVVLAGAKDRVLPVAESVWVARRVPRATLQVYAGAGHMLPLERAPEVASAIAAIADADQGRPTAALLNPGAPSAAAGAGARRTVHGPP